MKEFDFPIINDHFILEKSPSDFIVPEPPTVELVAGQVLGDISDILEEAKGIPGIPDIDGLIKSSNHLMLFHQLKLCKI